MSLKKLNFKIEFNNGKTSFNIIIFLWIRCKFKFIITYTLLIYKKIFVKNLTWFHIISVINNDVKLHIMIERVNNILCFDSTGIMKIKIFREKIHLQVRCRRSLIDSFFPIMSTVDVIFYISTLRISFRPFDPERLLKHFRKFVKTRMKNR